jgi:hypothetical protein
MLERSQPDGEDEEKSCHMPGPRTLIAACGNGGAYCKITRRQGAKYVRAPRMADPGRPSRAAAPRAPAPLAPMMPFIRVRAARRRHTALPQFPIDVYRRINNAELALVVVIVFAAAFMARGTWLF